MRLYHVTVNRARSDQAHGLRRTLVVFESFAKTTKAVFRQRAAGRSVALDCGAYMAMTQRRKIDLGEYIETCFAVRSAVDFFASLDVIGDPVASDAQWREMVRRGLPEAVPTFHIGDPASALQDILDGAPYIAIGGIAGLMYSRNERIEFLDWCFSRIVAHPSWPIPVHGWGITDRPLLSLYPWRSVDSSVVFQRRRFHRVKGPGGQSLQRGSAALIDAQRRREDLDNAADHVTEEWSKKGLLWTPYP